MLDSHKFLSKSVIFQCTFYLFCKKDNSLKQNIFFSINLYAKNAAILSYYIQRKFYKDSSNADLVYTNIYIFNLFSISIAGYIGYK